MQNWPKPRPKPTQNEHEKSCIPVSQAQKIHPNAWRAKMHQNAFIFAVPGVTLLRENVKKHAKYIQNACKFYAKWTRKNMDSDIGLAVGGGKIRWDGSRDRIREQPRSGRKVLEITRKVACRELPRSSSPLLSYSVYNTDSAEESSHARDRISRIHASNRLMAVPRNSTERDGGTCPDTLTGRSTHTSLAE